MKYFIDTNIFLRTLIKEHEQTYNRSYALLDSIKKNSVSAVTASVVLAEVSWTLLSYYKVPKQKAASAISGIINLRGLKIIDSYNHGKAISLWQKYNVKYIDALIASIDEIDSREWTIVSYDKDFDKLGVLRVEP